MPLPIRLAAEFPDELVATPIEDIDPYYSNKKVSGIGSFRAARCFLVSVKVLQRL
jgi:hypothetical protein